VIDDGLVAVVSRVPILHHREAVVPVLLSVGLLAHPEEATVEEPRRAREHPFSGEALQGKVLRAFGAETRKGARELERVVELLLVTALPPALVVQVLSPSCRVGADGLKVSVLVGTDPDVDPGGRDRERLDPRPRLPGNARAVGLQVGESLAAPAPREPGGRGVDAAESGHGEPGTSLRRRSATCAEHGARRSASARAASRTPSGCRWRAASRSFARRRRAWPDRSDSPSSRPRPSCRGLPSTCPPSSSALPTSAS